MVQAKMDLTLGCIIRDHLHADLRSLNSKSNERTWLNLRKFLDRCAMVQGICCSKGYATQC